ncbi:hypothetical protein CP02DC15_1136, partial [Chlamydia psittaci 02DC15]
QS